MAVTSRTSKTPVGAFVVSQLPIFFQKRVSAFIDFPLEAIVINFGFTSIINASLFPSRIHSFLEIPPF